MHDLATLLAIKFLAGSGGYWESELQWGHSHFEKIGGGYL